MKSFPPHPTTTRMSAPQLASAAVARAACSAHACDVDDAPQSRSPPVPTKPEQIKSRRRAIGTAPAVTPAKREGDGRLVQGTQSCELVMWNTHASNGGRSVV
eukprot:2265249-Prymnesium_polylepis.2